MKDRCWSWNSNTLATWCEELTHWKRPWWWERLKVKGEEDDRGWDGWMAPPTQWTWVWVNSGSRWWTGKTGMLQSMGSQSVGHDWTAELNWTAANNWLPQKYHYVGKDWRQEENGMTIEEEMVGCHHWLDGYEFKQSLEVCNRQGSLVCCSQWGCSESDRTEWQWLNIWRTL